MRIFPHIIFLDPVGVLRLNPIPKTDDKRNRGKNGGGNKGKTDLSSPNDLIGGDGQRGLLNENESLKVPAVESASATESSGSD